MKKYSTFLNILLIASIIFVNGCSKEEPTIECEKYQFKELNFEYYQPNCINFLFQVTDSEGLGVIGLKETDFKVLENDKIVGSEAGVTIVPNDQIPYTIKTVLLIDVSTSVQNEIAGIKEAAITMANNKASNQEIAVYTFSSSLNMELNFSGNKVDIIDAINSISVGSSSTNLYGALAGVSNLYTEVYTTQQIVAGNIVLFTDGDDTQGSVVQSDAISAMSDKSLYIVALNGPDYTDDTRQVMNSFSPIKLLESSNVSELASLFDETIQNIIRISMSTYWLYFSSPKRGGNTHQLSLEFNCENNSNSITSSFNSTGFADGTCSTTTGPSGSFDCISGNCQSSTNGTYSSLASCQAVCGSTSGSYDCVNGNCQTSTNGIYSSLADCQNVCGGNPGGTVYLTKDFNFNGITSGGWLTFTDNISYDWIIQGTFTEKFGYAYNYNGNGVHSATNAWFVSPSMDLSNSINPILNFRNAYNYSGNPLEVMISSNYSSGNPSSATWTALNPILSNGNFSWTDSGDIILSAYKTSNVHIAFKYTGSNADGSTWQIDDIIIKEQ